MKIEHVILTHPWQAFTMGVDDPGRLKSSELRVLICPTNTYYSKQELKYAYTRLRAGDIQVVVVDEGSKAEAWLKEMES